MIYQCFPTEPVLRNKQITCFDAAFLLAYSTFVREKDALVYSFTESKDKLEPLHRLMPKNNFRLAKEAIDMHTVHIYLLIKLILFSKKF